MIKGVEVAATESDILRDEQERGSLLRTIASVEAAIAASPPGTRRILETTVDNARKRITTLDKKIEEGKVERAAEQQAQTAAAELAAKETKLSAKEQDTYRGFMEETYFTKKDVGRLDSFYQHGYDRLSEGGKEEMHKRLHEGIKRGELKASELPDSILKRDFKFSREHNANEISEPEAHATRARGQFQNAEKVKSAKFETDATAKSSNTEIDLSSVNLKGVSLAAATTEPSAASIPDASGSSVKGRS